MVMLNFVLIIYTLYIIPSESRHSASYPWIDCAVEDMGFIQCGETVQGFTSIESPNPPNFWNSWTFAVIGSDECEITFSFCSNYSNYSAALNVHDFDTFEVLFDNAFAGEFEENCPDGSYPASSDGAPHIYSNVTFNATTCTPYYIRIGGRGREDSGPYELTATCSAGCTPCTVEAEDGGEEEEDESNESSDSVDDAKADIAERELPDGEMFGYMDEDGVDNNNEYSKEVTLRIADKVWEGIYGVMIVSMVCCGLFCYMFSRINKD